MAEGANLQIGYVSCRHRNKDEKAFVGRLSRKGPARSEPVTSVCRRGSRGKRTMNSLPRFLPALWTSTRTPCCVTISYTTCNPTAHAAPVRLFLDDTSKMCGRVAVSMPRPLSAMMTRNLCLIGDGRDRNPASRVSVLGRVHQQIREDLPQPPSIS